MPKSRLILIWFQSTHPCGVRLATGADFNTQRVSIHAPVWGATTNPDNNTQGYWVSIHAPVWGATWLTFGNR